MNTPGLSRAFRTSRLSAVLVLLVCVVLGLLQGYLGSRLARATEGNSNTAQANTAVLSLAQVRVSPGAPITVPLSLALPQGQVYSVDIVVAYDSNVATALRVERGALLEGWGIATNLEASGLVRVALAGAIPLQTGGELLLIYFEAIGPLGSGTDLTLTRGDLNEGSILTVLEHGRLSIEVPTATPTATATSTPTASATATATPSATATVASASLLGRVQLQGRGRPPGENWAVPLTVTLHFPGALTPTLQFSPTADFSGQFMVMGIPAGTYDVKVRKARSLVNQRVNVSLAPGANSLDLGPLLEGDANEDSVIDDVDYSRLTRAYFRQSGQDDFEDSVDFNGDKRVNSLDYSLLASNYLRQSGTTIAGGNSTGK